MTTKAVFKCCICKNTHPGFHLGVLLEHIAVEHEEIALYQCSMCKAKFFTAAFASYHVKCNHKNKEGIIDTVDPTRVPLEKLKNVYEKYTASICPDHSRYSPCVKIDRLTQTDFVKAVPPPPRIIRSVLPSSSMHPLLVNNDNFEGNNKNSSRNNQHSVERLLLDKSALTKHSPLVTLINSPKPSASQATETTDCNLELQSRPAEDLIFRNTSDMKKFPPSLAPPVLLPIPSFEPYPLYSAHPTI